MRCKDCPASWEDRDYYYGVQDWGCYCDPKSGSDCGREFKDGSFGCNRKLSYIQKVLKKVEKEKKIENEMIVKQMADFVEFCKENYGD
jgi:hypothetical protein